MVNSVKVIFPHGEFWKKNMPHGETVDITYVYI